MNKAKSLNIWQLAILILAGESIFFLPFVIARVFRPTFLSVFDISNLELGALYSIYGIIAMAAYFFGGPLADRFAPRNLLSIALLLTGAGGLFMAFFQNYTVLSWLYGFWGITTILLFWAALIKATRMLGGAEFQGRAFGILEGGRGFIAAFASSLAVAVYALYLPQTDIMASSIEQQNAFQQVILFFSVWVLVVGLVIWRFLSINDAEEVSAERISAAQISQLIKMPMIWFQSVIIVCAYVGYKITDDFSLLAKEVLGYSDVEAAQVGTMALWMRVVTAILAGILADRVGQSSKVISWSFLLMFIGGLSIGSGWIPPLAASFYVLIILSTSLGVYAVRGLYFALIQEADIPAAVTGTAVGVISVVGFTPDVFMGPVMGYLLDSYPGPLGHQLVFLVLAVFALAGWTATRAFRKTTSSV